MQQRTARTGGFRPARVYPIEETFQYFDWFAHMRAEHPVFYDEQTHLWQVFRYNDIQKTLLDYEHFSSEAVPGFSEDTFLRDTVVAKDPPDHRKLRNLVNLAFTPRAVNHLAEDIAHITRELLSERLDQGVMDIVSDVAFPLPAKVIAAMLGVPAEDWDIFRRWASGSDGGPAPQTREEAERSRHAMGQQMYDYFVDLLAERRREPRGDLISGLSVAEIDGSRLSESELVNFCILLLAAGQETTKNLIANAIYCFAQHPQTYEQLVQNPDLMPAAIEEILRYLPPVWFTLRRTTTEIELAGQHIPAQAIVQLWNASANHDTAVFADPEQFIIQRDPNRHLTFGHGIHFCIGAPLARLEARVALPIMLQQLKHLQLVPDSSIMVNAGLVYVIRSLPITFQTF
jgi:cytochrome P450